MRDRVMNVPAVAVCRAAMAAIDRLQDERPEVLLPALAGAFLLACQRHGLHPGVALEAANRIIASVDRRRPEFRAIAQYLKEEVPSE